MFYADRIYFLAIGRIFFGVWLGLPPWKCLEPSRQKNYNMDKKQNMNLYQ